MTQLIQQIQLDEGFLLFVDGQCKGYEDDDYYNPETIAVLKRLGIKVDVETIGYHVTDWTIPLWLEDLINNPAGKTWSDVQEGDLTQMKAGPSAEEMIAEIKSMLGVDTIYFGNTPV